MNLGGLIRWPGGRPGLRASTSSRVTDEHPGPAGGRRPRRTLPVLCASSQVSPEPAVPTGATGTCLPAGYCPPCGQTSPAACVCEGLCKGTENPRWLEDSFPLQQEKLSHRPHTQSLKSNHFIGCLQFVKNSLSSTLRAGALLCLQSAL